MHLRLNAGLSFLKLLSVPNFQAYFEKADFRIFGLLLQDQVYSVRNIFIDRLCTALATKRIPSKFTMLLILVAHEPESDLKMKAKTMLARQAKQQLSVSQTSTPSTGNSRLLEHHFADVFYLLSHHEDFSMEKDDLEHFETYVNFYLVSLATPDNISLLYAASGKMKTVKDKEMDDCTPLYVIAEMFILRIREYCASHNWTLQSYPGKINIPRDYYEKLDDASVSKNLKIVYYTDGETKLKKAAPKPNLKKYKEVSSDSDQDSASGSDSTRVESKAKRQKVELEIEEDSSPQPKRQSNRLKRLSNPIVQ
jgi:sister chromatid cohesion protein PDS5